MRKNTKNATFFLAALFLALQSLVLSNATPAQAAYYCQCVDFVKQKVGIPASEAVGNAKDMGSYLASHGFTRVNAQPGAIAVMGTSFPGSNPTWGHVGLIETTRSSGGNTFIALRTANQGGNGSDANCNNVNVLNFGTAVNGRNDIAFYAKGGNTNTGNNGSIQSVNFTGTTSNYQTNVRSAPSSSANIVSYIQPNQRVSFDAWTYGSTVNDLWTGQPDRRWYKVAGTNSWVASAAINGNAPGSQP
jgi:Bacterial SH3 domain